MAGETEEKPRRDIFAVFESVAKIIASVALPVVLLVLGNWYTESQKDKDIGQKYVEIAVEILAADPTEETRQLRTWAVEVVNRYSEIKMNTDLATELIESAPLPLRIQNEPRQGFREFLGKRQVTKIIISDTQNRDVDSELGALDQFGVSYHYLVTADGQILGLVDENDVAFHTSKQNSDSIGIGVMHVAGDDYPPAQIDALARLVRDVAERHGVTAENIAGKDRFDPRKRSDFGKISDAVLKGLK